MITRFEIFNTKGTIPVNKNINKILNYIDLVSIKDKHQQPQFSFENSEKKAEFLKFIDEIADYTFIDELKGIARESTNLNIKDIIHNVYDSWLGIKVVKNPISKFSPWENWNDGYVEGYCRMDGNDINHDWFVFCYIKMNKLKEILEKYKDDLILL